MGGILSCINNVLIFIILVIPGFFAKKRGLIDSKQIDGFSMLLVNFMWPAMVIDVMNTTKVTNELKHITLQTGVICFVIYIISAFIAYLYWKMRGAEKTLIGVLAFCVTCNNTGFIGMPYIQASLGDKALFIATIAELVNDIIIFTVGVFFMQLNKSGKKTIDFKSMLSPGCISVFIGLLIFFLNIPIPDCLGQALEYMSRAITAMAMFVVGAQLGEIKLTDIFRKRYVWEVCIFRLIIIPTAVMLVLSVLFQGQAIIIKVLTLMYAMPVASCASVIVRQYKNDYQAATSYVMSSTVVLMVTLPVWSIVVSAI